MITLLLHLLPVLSFLFGGHRQLALENLALRQQLAVYKRTLTRPPLRRTDRLFWVALARAWAGWKQPLVIVTPDTVPRWQRRRFREYWTKLSGRPTGGRPSVNAEIKVLVARIATANPVWGAPRIHGELLRLGLDVSERLRAPSAAHWLGTDELGRDVLSRVLHGARITVQIQLAAVGLALAIGTALGLTAGYIGRWVDQLIMRLMDILMAFPGIFLALAIIAALGTGLGNVIIAAGIFLVPQFARLMRASVLMLKDMELSKRRGRSARATSRSSSVTSFPTRRPRSSCRRASGWRQCCSRRQGCRSSASAFNRRPPNGARCSPTPAPI